MRDTDREATRATIGTLFTVILIAILAGLWSVFHRPTDSPPPKKVPVGLTPTLPTAEKVSAPGVAVELGLKPLPGQPSTLADGEVSRDLRVTYTSMRKDGALHVGYHLPYLEHQRAGESIRGVSLDRPPFDWEVPVLSVKVLNNSAQSVMVTECIAEVTASRIDAEPVLVVADRSVEAVLLVNEGWGDVIDPMLTFKIHALKGEGDQGSSAVERHALELKTFTKDCLTRLSRFVPKALEDESAVAVTGDVEFGPAGQRKKVPFTTTMVFDILPRNPVPPSYQYDLALTAGKAPDTVTVSVSHNLKPGEADQFLLRVASDKSAHYEFKLAFRSVEGRQLAVQDLVLDVFVPRSMANRAEKAPTVDAF